jgi:hypothetical protein
VTELQAGYHPLSALGMDGNGRTGAGPRAARSSKGTTPKPIPRSAFLEQLRLATNPGQQRCACIIVERTSQAPALEDVLSRSPVLEASDPRGANQHNDLPTTGVFFCGFSGFGLEARADDADKLIRQIAKSTDRRINPMRKTDRILRVMGTAYDALV